jgi:PIN domain nuclease of toxin-antitoxin system
MNVLLDTCALLALARGELPQSSSAALRNAPEAWISVITPWEVTIKAAAGKLVLAEPPYLWFLAMIERHDIQEIELSSQIACAAAGLPDIHQDPFDRIPVALAQARGLTILTSDRNIAKYPGIKILW